MDNTEKIIKNMQEAPVEIKKKGRKLHETIQRLRHAERQSELWRIELAHAQAEHDLANWEYGQASLRWDVETQTMEKLEEIKPQ